MFRVNYQKGKIIMKNILLIVDMQNGFARYPQTVALTNKIKKLLELNIFDTVVATRFLNDTNSIYEQLFDWKKLKTEEERALAPGYEKYVDYVFDKYIYNCVTPNFLQKLCQINDGKYPEKIFIVGADTDCCVLTIATNLFENNIRPIVLTNYCDSNGGSDSHNAGLLCMKRLIGEKQLTNIEITAETNLEML